MINFLSVRQRYPGMRPSPLLASEVDIWNTAFNEAIHLSRNYERPMTCSGFLGGSASILGMVQIARVLVNSRREESSPDNMHVLAIFVL